VSDTIKNQEIEEQLLLEEEHRTKLNALRLVVGGAISLLVGGSIFYHFVEGWSYFDSLWFSVVSLATVGYGDMVPHTVEGKTFTMFFIFAGVTVFVRTAQLVNDAMTISRKKRIARRVARRRARHESNGS
jgi:voltage-gated potassium channel Kch